MGRVERLITSAQLIQQSLQRVRQGGHLSKRDMPLPPFNGVRDTEYGIDRFRVMCAWIQLE